MTIGVHPARAGSSRRGRLEAVATVLPSRGWWGTGALTLLLALWTIVPWRPASLSGDPPYLDTSWMVVLHLAFEDGLTFGREIVFTYGPWGFVSTRIYVPGTFGWLLGWWIVVAVALWYAAFAVALATMRSPVWAAAWISTLVLLVSLGFEAPFIAVAALFIVASVPPVESKLLTSAELILAALLAWLGLVKFTYLGLGIAVVLLVAMWLLVTRRRVGPALPTYLISLLGCWLLAGQPVGAMPDYVVNGLSLAAGYTPAMSLWSDTGLAVRAFAAAALTVLLVLWLERGTGRRLPIVAAALGLTLYVSFKGGFVRQDDAHTPIGLLGLAVVAMVVAPQFLKSACGRPRQKRIIASAILVTVALAAWGEAAVPGPRQQVEYIVRSADDTLQFFVHPNRTATSRRAAWRAAVAEVRANVPVPNVPGAVDLYPNDQLVLVAHGLNRSTRPVFQSYFAYNPRLVGLNEAYLRGEHRPRTLFVDISPIDGRWPASEDAPSLLEILARYRLEDDTGQYLIFSRAVVGSVRLHPAGAVASRLGAHVAVPRPTRGPVWASFDVGQSLVGRIEEFLFKQPTLAITATLADGRVVRHRLVPGLAETGFIISPYVGDRGDFAELARGTWRTALASNRVVSIQVDVAGGAVYGYTGRLDVSFMRAEFKPPIARSRR